MTTKTRRKQYQQAINNRGILVEDVIKDLEIDLETVKRYISGTPYFEDQQYIRFIKYIGLAKEELGYVKAKSEQTVKNPFSLFKIDKHNTPFKRQKFIMFRYNILKKNSIKEIKEGFGNNLFFNKTYETPFLYKYFFILLVLLVLLNVGTSNIVMLSNLLIASSIPVTLLILLYEFDKSEKNLLKILAIALLGGIASIGLTHIIRSFTGYPTGFVGDITTGLVEETAKLLVVILIFKFVPVRYAFTGLLIGFAVGAGFDVLETSDYGVMALIESEGGSIEMQLNLLLRSAYALGIGHHFWTGILAAAIQISNKYAKFSLKSLLSPLFISLYVIIVLFHATWNFVPYQFLSILLTVIGGFSFFVIANNLYYRMVDDTIKSQEPQAWEYPVS